MLEVYVRYRHIFVVSREGWSLCKNQVPPIPAPLRPTHVLAGVPRRNPWRVPHKLRPTCRSAQSAPCSLSQRDPRSASASPWSWVRRVAIFNWRWSCFTHACNSFLTIASRAPNGSSSGRTEALLRAPWQDPRVAAVRRTIRRPCTPLRLSKSIA